MTGKAGRVEADNDSHCRAEAVLDFTNNIQAKGPSFQPEARARSL